MRTVSLTSLTVSVKDTRRKAGSSPQNAGPKLKSNPSDPTGGRPIHDARATPPKSTTPKPAAARQPAKIPSTALQTRTRRGARSIRPTTVRPVTVAMTGAAAAGALSGTLASMANPRGTTDRATRQIRAPDTTGVTMCLSRARRAAMMYWNSAEATTSAPRRGGPPAARARAATPTDAPAGPITVTVPAPIRPIRLVWTMVSSPAITIPAETDHDRYASP